jgi:hypothetical protein
VTLKPATFRLETELLDAMQGLREREGVPVSEQVRRGILLWLEQKGVTVKTERRTATRTHRKNDDRRSDLRRLDVRGGTRGRWEWRAHAV